MAFRFQFISVNIVYCFNIIDVTSINFLLKNLFNVYYFGIKKNNCDNGFPAKNGFVLLLLINIKARKLIENFLIDGYDRSLRLQF